MYLGNQVPSRGTNMARKLQINFSNALVSVRVALRFKWWITHEKFVGQHTETPYVNVCIVGQPLYHLRRQIVQRTAQSLAAQTWRVHAPAEVRNLQVATMIQEQVFRLDVAVNDVLAMAINRSMS